MSRSVASGESITLYCEFYDLDTSGNKILINPDSTPTVSIYDAFHDPRSSSIDLVNDAIVYRASATQITTGIYSYTYTVPSSQITNYWFDLWEATINSISGQAVMQFLVTGTDDSQTPLANNYLVQVILDKTISDEDGNTLEEDYEFWFTTTFEPMYSDPELLRLYVGPWISSVPDETLALMLYESSKLADDITPKGRNKNLYYQNARTRFVTYDAALRLLSLSVNQSSGMTKSLGDLLVKRDGNNFLDMLNKLLKNRDEWFAIVNSMEDIVPGQSYAPLFAVKGRYDPDRRNIGRRWDETSYNQLSGTNDKHVLEGRRLYSFYMNRNLKSTTNEEIN